MAVIILMVAGMVWAGSWVRKIMREGIGSSIDKNVDRLFWIALHFIILAGVMLGFVEEYIDGAISAIAIGAWNEVTALSGVAVLVLIVYNLFFDAAMGFIGIGKKDFDVYLKDADRFLTYLMNLLAVLGFFYPAIGMDSQRESRGLLVCALTAFFDMVALDAYKILVRPLGIGMWVDDKIRICFDRRAHKLREKVQNFLHHKDVEKPLSNEKQNEDKSGKS